MTIRWLSGAKATFFDKLPNYSRKSNKRHSSCIKKAKRHIQKKSTKVFKNQRFRIC